MRHPAANYATALHELGHWTGHPDRIDRDQKIGADRNRHDGPDRQGRDLAPDAVAKRARHEGERHDAVDDEEQDDSPPRLDEAACERNEYQCGAEAGEASNEARERGDEKQREHEIERGQGEAAPTEPVQVAANSSAAK